MEVSWVLFSEHWRALLRTSGLNVPKSKIAKLLPKGWFALQHLAGVATLAYKSKFTSL